MKVNKFIAGIMAVCVMGFGVPYVNTVAENNSVIIASAESEAEYTEGTYELLTYINYGDYIEISDCDRSATEVVIPAEINGLPVTNIGNRAFEDCSNLTSIKIPDSVTRIGNRAFEDCSNLTSIKIPDSVTRIGSSAFYECSNLTSIKIPDSVTVIEHSTFYRCNNLTSVIIPNSVTSIGPGAFYGCDNLTSVIIPDSVTRIGYNAFYYCTALTSIEIPKSITNIESSTFESCKNLISIDIPDSVINIGGNSFSDTLWLEEKRKENPLVVVNNILIDGKTCTGDVVIPDSVTSIGSNAFAGCHELTSIKIPNNVTNIGDYAFYYCENLKSVDIPNSIKIINTEAFSKTLWLEEKRKENPFVIVNNILIDAQTYTGDVIVPDSVTSISGRAFVGCDVISVEIPESVTSIGDQVFYYCSKLKKVSILNPDCEIYDSSTTISNEFTSFEGTIYGYEDSTAQAYAEKYGRNFVSLGKAPEKETVAGDMNGDNSVNIADAVFLQNCILGRQELTEEQFKNADLTGDGVVDSFDMVLIRCMIIENNK